METKLQSQEDIQEFLTKNGIEWKLVNFNELKYSRTIEFKVYETTYRIIWFINQSTLQIMNGSNRPSCIPFKYISFDGCFPLIGGNKSILFSYVKLNKQSIFDREFPYEGFRIPLELKK